MDPRFRFGLKEGDAERRHILLFAVIFVLLFAAMGYSFISTAIRDKVELFDNDYNSRDLLLEEHNRRGRILAAGGEELACLSLTAAQDVPRIGFWPLLLRLAASLVGR